MGAPRCAAVSIDGTLSCRLPAGHAGYHMTHAGTSFVYDAGRSLEANVAEAAQYASSTRPAPAPREHWQFLGRSLGYYLWECKTAGRGSLVGAVWATPVRELLA